MKITGKKENKKISNKSLMLFRIKSFVKTKIIDPGTPVFTFASGLDPSVEESGGHLHTVADAQDRDAQVEDGRIAERSLSFEHARRSS